MSNHDLNTYLRIAAVVLALIALLVNIVSNAYNRGFIAGLKAGRP